MFEWIANIAGVVLREQGTATFPVTLDNPAGGPVRTGPDGTPDPEGEFYVCAPCHAVVPLLHECPHIR